MKIPHSWLQNAMDAVEKQEEKEKEERAYQKLRKTALVGYILMIAPFIIAVVEIGLQHICKIRFGIYNIFLIIPAALGCFILGSAISVRIYQQFKEEIKKL